jgi:hypothetical protein
LRGGTAYGKKEQGEQRDELPTHILLQQSVRRTVLRRGHLVQECKIIQSWAEIQHLLQWVAKY